MQKKYTAVRRFYAIVGFLAIIVGIVVGIIKLSELLSNRDQVLLQKTYCHAERDNGSIFAWEC
jgi:hypothetical protein